MSVSDLVFANRGLFEDAEERKTAATFVHIRAISTSDASSPRKRWLRMFSSSAEYRLNSTWISSLSTRHRGDHAAGGQLDGQVQREGDFRARRDDVRQVHRAVLVKVLGEGLRPAKPPSKEHAVEQGGGVGHLQCRGRKGGTTSFRLRHVFFSDFPRKETLPHFGHGLLWTQ